MALNLSNETWWAFFGYQMDRRKKTRKRKQHSNQSWTIRGILGRISDHIAPSSMAIKIHHDYLHHIFQHRDTTPGKSISMTLTWDTKNLGDWLIILHKPNPSKVSWENCSVPFGVQQCDASSLWFIQKYSFA